MAPSSGDLGDNDEDLFTIRPGDVREGGLLSKTKNIKMSEWSVNKYFEMWHVWGGVSLPKFPHLSMDSIWILAILEKYN